MVERRRAVQVGVAGRVRHGRTSSAPLPRAAGAPYTWYRGSPSALSSARCAGGGAARCRVRSGQPAAARQPQYLEFRRRGRRGVGRQHDDVRGPRSIAKGEQRTRRPARRPRSCVRTWAATTGPRSSPTTFGRSPLCRRGRQRGDKPCHRHYHRPPGHRPNAVGAADGIQKFYLPWVPELKGDDADTCGASVPLAASVVSPKSAYHLVSSVPVTVYQFNALEYAPKGGRAGKTGPRAREALRAWIKRARSSDSRSVLLVHERLVAPVAEHGDDRQLPRGRLPRRIGGHRVVAEPVMGSYFVITRPSTTRASWSSCPRGQSPRRRRHRGDRRRWPIQRSCSTPGTSPRLSAHSARASTFGHADRGQPTRPGHRRHALHPDSRRCSRVRPPRAVRLSRRDFGSAAFRDGAHESDRLRQPPRRPPLRQRRRYGSDLRSGAPPGCPATL